MAVAFGPDHVHVTSLHAQLALKSESPIDLLEFKLDEWQSFVIACVNSVRGKRALLWNGPLRKASEATPVPRGNLEGPGLESTIGG